VCKIEAKCTKSIKGRHNREPIGRKRERKENEEEVIQKMPAEQRQEEAKEILNTSKQAAKEATSKRTDEEQPSKKTKYSKVAPQQTPNTKETEHQIRTLATTLEKEDKKVMDKEQEITSGAFTKSITGNKCGEEHEGQIGNSHEEKEKEKRRQKKIKRRKTETTIQTNKSKLPAATTKGYNDISEEERDRGGRKESVSGKKAAETAEKVYSNGATARSSGETGSIMGDIKRRKDTEVGQGDEAESLR
jgi:hypothetical protein